MVTVNSDDPAYFGGYIADNFRALYDIKKITKADVFTLCRNSVKVSFLGEPEKAAILARIDKAEQELA